MKENIYGTKFDSEAVASGLHRSAIGGRWEELGEKQFYFVLQQGLLPTDAYYGFDINQTLLDAGYDVELKTVNLQEKLPRSHLLANSEFNMVPFQRNFTYALAFSLFTHLTVNSIRRCLIELSRVLDCGGKFYATVFLIQDSDAIEKSFRQSSEITSYADKDPYHYRLSDMECLANQTGFEVRLVSEFDHPRNQQMLEFVYK